MDALVEWLGVTEDHVHVTNSKRDTDLTGRRFACLIASYNFLGDLVDRSGWPHHPVLASALRCVIACLNVPLNYPRDTHLPRCSAVYLISSEC